MSTEQVRADFEAWVRRDMPRLSLRLVDFFMGYTEKETQTAFLAYQAGRAALQSQDAEDAQRYRKLRAMATQQADSLGPIFRIDVRRSAPYLFNFDAAIDHARRIEGEAK